MIHLDWIAYSNALNHVIEAADSDISLQLLEERCKKLEDKSDLVAPVYASFHGVLQKLKDLSEQKSFTPEEAGKALRAFGRVEAALAMLIAVLESDYDPESDTLKLRIQALTQMLSIAYQKNLIQFSNPEKLSLKDIIDFLKGQKSLIGVPV